MLGILQTNRIDPLILKENYLLGLVFPRKGVIPVRITEREEVTYRYTELTEFAADEWRASAKLAQATQSIANILEVMQKDELIHMFMGMDKACVRAYPGYPVDIPRKRLPRVTRPDKGDMGYIDGSESPSNDPSPQTEMFIPYNIDVGWAFWNTADYPVSLILNLVAWRYRFKVVKDLDTVMNILNGRTNCRMATLGGLDELSYVPQETFNTDAIPFGSSKATVAAILGNKLGGE